MTKITVRAGNGGEVLVGLSRRERQILVGLLRGSDVKTMAHRLGLQPGTIRSYIKNLCRGLRVSGRGELLSWALQQDKRIFNGEKVPQHRHAPGCSCQSILCSALRAARVRDVDLEAA
jgi:DNA-binding CsgD family transcriptional regulator